MEKKFNPLDLTQVSKKQLDRSKRIEEQTAGFLKLHDQKLREEAALLEKKKHEALASGAMFSKNSAYVKNKNRVKAVQEAIGYTDRATRAAMTDVMATIVEGALLLDTAEYAKLNPDYKKSIREQIATLLEKGKISKAIKNKKTLKVMDHVAKSIPDVKTGVYLKEQELIDIVRKSTPGEINNVISSLTGDVKERVANLVVKEQDSAAEIQSEINDLSKTNSEAEAAKLKSLGYSDQEIAAAAQQDAALQQMPSPDQQMMAQGAPSPEMAAPQQAGPAIPPEVEQQLKAAGVSIGPDGQPIGPDGQPLTPESLQQLMTGQQGPSPEEAAAAEQQGPSEEELMAAQQQPGITNPAPEFDEYGQEIEPEQIAPAAASNGSFPPASNTAVEISPDGTVKVNIVRERFFREHPRQKVLESLALNEALDMVKSGKQYNGDLALANAIAHLTVLEAFNATGLIPISELDYARMLSIPLIEAKKAIKKSAAAKPVATKLSKPVEHKPEVKQSEVHKGEQKAEEVKAPLIEAKKNWKDKVKETMAKQEAEKPWNKKAAEGAKK
jgi:hypothetical protein